MIASAASQTRNPLSDPTRLTGLGVLVAVTASVFVPAMVAPWQQGVLTPELMGALLQRALRSQPFLYALPVALAACILILRARSLVGAVDAFGEVLDRWRDIESTGKFTRFFVKPFVWLSSSLWDQTQGITHADVRTALRLMVQAYIIGVFLFIAFTALIALLVILAIGLALLVVSFFVGGSGGSENTVKNVTRIKESRKARDWIGEHTDHFDERGRKVAESRPDSDFVGEKVTHRDASGRIVGESRKTSDWVGDKTVHYSATGDQVGESRADSDFVGEKVVHYDRSGTQVGESREHSDFLGGHVEHDGTSPPDLLGRPEAKPDEDDAFHEEK